MRNLKRLVSGAAALALSTFALAGNAGAVVYTATFTGTVTSIADNGTFGTFDGSLAGSDYTAVFVVDTSVGYFNGPNHYYLHGDPGPVQSASLTINGITQSVVGTNWSEIQDLLIDNGALNQYALSAANSDASFKLTSELDNGIYCHPCTHNQNIGVDGDSGDAPVSYTSVAPEDVRQGGFLLSGASGVLEPTGFTIEINSVPEPAQWSLLILGFGGAGALMRRRRDSLETV